MQGVRRGKLDSACPWFALEIGRSLKGLSEAEEEVEVAGFAHGGRGALI